MGLHVLDTHWWASLLRQGFGAQGHQWHTVKTTARPLDSLRSLGVTESAWVRSTHPTCSGHALVGEPPSPRLRSPGPPVPHGQDHSETPPLRSG